MRDTVSGECTVERLRPQIGLVAGRLPPFDDLKYRVLETCSEGLRALGDELAFDFFPVERSITTREEARLCVRELEPLGLDFVLFLHSSFVLGDIVQEFADASFRVGLWATEEPVRSGPIPLNNFVAVNLSAGVLVRWLRERNIPFKWFYGNVDSPDFRARLKCTVDALRVCKRLASARIGWVGGLAPTFVNVSFDPRTLAATTGAEVESIEIRDLIARTRRQPDSRANGVVSELRHAVNGRVEVSDKDMLTSAKVYLAMKELASEARLDALAVRDWPEFQSDLAIHPGMAFSWLDEHDSIPVASEGDVLGAVTQLAVREASGRQPLLLDMNDVDFDHDAVLMWHCGGSPIWFADDDGVSWSNHSTIDRHITDAAPMGAIADLKFRPGPATVARIGDGGRELFAIDADIVAGPAPGFHGSRGWFSNFESDGQSISARDLVNTVFSEGIEHHYIVGSERRADVLYEVAAWCDMRTVQPIPYRNHLQRPRFRRGIR